MSKEEPLEILLEQYKRCCEDWRHFDSLLWQIPFSTSIATASILTLAYGWITNLFLKRVLLFFLSVFVIAMFILAIKIRFFQDVRTAFAREIEENLKVKGVKVETIESLNYLKERKGEPKSILLKIQSKICRVRAFYIQIILYVALIVLLFYLAIT